MTEQNNILNLQLEVFEPEEIELNIFKDLAAYLPSTSSLSAEQAAQKLNGLHPANRPDESGKEQSWHFFQWFWTQMFGIACQLDYEDEPMQRFVRLISALRKLPRIADAENGQVWEDLPGMAMCHLEYWQSDGPSKDLRRWRNFNGMMVFLTKYGEFDCIFEGIVSIREALETPPKKITQDVIDRVPVAAIWFQVCSLQIYQACKEGRVRSENEDDTIWKGPAGFSIERWYLWRQRLLELGVHKIATATTKQTCETAVAAMDAVNSQGNSLLGLTR